jgi:hypothetical protein
MKRFFTLTALFAFALLINAQGYRKWDFTNWSTQTIENLKADAAASSTEGWSDIEKKADAGEGKTAPETTAGKCFWLTDAEGGTLKANGVIIPETEGLDFSIKYTPNRSLAIAVDYPSTSLGDYAGPQYLWLGGGGKKVPCFTIPKVRVGQKMTFVVESHKPADARGIELYVGSVTDENKIGESFKPTVQATNTWEDWTLPEGVTADDDLVDIIVYNTSGCHIYSIEVGTPDQKAKVAYLFNGDLNADLAFPTVCMNDKYEVEPIEAAGAQSLETLTAYDAIVISSTVTNAEAIASLKTILPFEPVLNLNPALYEAWGYGAIGTAEDTYASILNKNHPLFRGLEIIEEGETVGLEITKTVNFKGITLDGYFLKDDTLATVMGSTDVAIHAHKLSHNGYLFLPYTQETIEDIASADLIFNALSVLIDSKAKVSQAPKPSISLEYKDMNTNVTLSSSIGAQIFYTIDGSEPTEQSTLYTEPFNISQDGITVKAVALGDGYLLSDVAEQLVDLKQQAQKPVIAVESQEGKSLVSISSTMEGVEAQIYYNFSGSKDAAQSSLYDGEPVAVTKSKTIYAFVAAEGYVNSDLVSEEIKIQNEKVRIDVLAHMDANSAEYNGGSTSTAYYFSWAKNKTYAYYDIDSRQEETTVSPTTGADTTIVSYTVLNAEEVKDFENGWMLRSRGQVVDWENLSTGTNIGNTGGYNYATVNDIDADFPATKSVVVLADKNTEPADCNKFPYNAYITTTQKYAGPFDVVANIGSITKPDADAKHQVVLQVAKNGNEWDSDWQTLGDTLTIAGGRLTHNYVFNYEGTDEVYVRAYLCGGNSKAGFYDIYIANEGEKSKERLSGIAEQKQDIKAVPAGIYSLNGTRLNTVRRGFNIIRNSDGTTKKVLVK